MSKKRSKTPPEVSQKEIELMRTIETIAKMYRWAWRWETIIEITWAADSVLSVFNFEEFDECFDLDKYDKGIKAKKEFYDLKKKRKKK